MCKIFLDQQQLHIKSKIILWPRTKKIFLHYFSFFSSLTYSWGTKVAYIFWQNGYFYLFAYIFGVLESVRYKIKHNYGNPLSKNNTCILEMNFQSYVNIIQKIYFEMHVVFCKCSFGGEIFWYLTTITCDTETMIYMSLMIFL